MIISVQFQAGEFRGDWNTELRDPRHGRPIQTLSGRALHDATFAQNELRDLRAMSDLKEFAAIRAQMIEHHFLECARKLIADIEKAEGWPHALSDKEGKQ
jgi:hypothetical protein